MNEQLKHSQLPVYLQHVLPADYTYIFTKFQIIHHDNSAFSSTIFTDIHTEEEAKQWISTLEHQTDAYNKRSTDKRPKDYLQNHTTLPT